MSPVSPAIRRVRHPLKIRELTVKRLAPVSPRLLRVTLTGDLADFVSASFDDHVKLFLPAEGESRPSLPTVTEQGIAFDPGFNGLHVNRSPSRFHVAGDLTNSTGAHHCCVTLHHPVLPGSPNDVRQVAEAVAKVYHHREALKGIS